jgi:hypothetical protein
LRSNSFVVHSYISRPDLGWKKTGFEIMAMPKGLPPFPGIKTCSSDRAILDIWGLRENSKGQYGGGDVGLRIGKYEITKDKKDGFTSGCIALL